MIINKFKYEIGQEFKDEKRDLIITDRECREYIHKPNKNGKVYIQNQKWYKYTCNVCNWTEGWMVESNLTKCKGCSCCASRTVVPEINSIWATNKWMINLGVSEEDAKTHTPCSNKKIKAICPDCKKEKYVKVIDIYKYKSISCTCKDGLSYIFKYIVSVLDQLNIQYNTEVKYSWNKYINPKNNKIAKASIDFVIYKNGKEIPVEADGEFHRKDNSMSGVTKEMQQYIDKQRDENCLKYLGEKTIRISDEGDIRENILNSKLNGLFDLSNIDWLECEKFALKNRAKQICDYWNNKEEWETTQTIAQKFNLSRTTTTKYLKKGAKLGWCNYNPDLEKIKGGKSTTKFKYKAVEVFKDNISLGVFQSAKYLDNVSLDVFGVKFSRKSISRVCLGERRTHKGYIFKFV